MTKTSQLALLRGMNVGGNTTVAMADLRRLLTDSGFATPVTLLHSGNLAFGTGEEK